MGRVLFIGSGMPWSGGAGYLVRQGMLLRGVIRAVGAERVRLAMFDFPAGAEAGGEREFAGRVTRLEIEVRGRRGKAAAGIADLLDQRPRLVRDVSSCGAREAVRVLVAGAPDQGPALNGWGGRAQVGGRIDLVVAYRVDFAYYAGLVGAGAWRRAESGRPRLILDVDDPEHVRWRRREEASGRPMDWRTRRDLDKLRRFEQAAVASADVALVCQDQDRAAFESGNVVVVPNGVDVPAWKERGDGGPVAVILGNFAGDGNSPNVDGLRWFVREVWPRVSGEVTGAELKVVGRMSEEVRRELAGAAGVRAVGFVPTVTEAFEGARVSVAPLRYGTGTRVKILDALAHGCAVVSTRVGAEGLGLTNGAEALIADDAAELAAACSRVLSNAALARRLGRAGYEAVQRFEAGAIERRVEEVVKGVLRAESAEDVAGF